MKTVRNNADGTQTVVALEDGNLITGTVQDCTPIYEDAQARHNAGMFGTSEMRHAARIPVEAIEAYCNQRGITFEAFMQDKAHHRAILNDPHLSGFRIWKGQV